MPFLGDMMWWPKVTRDPKKGDRPRTSRVWRQRTTAWATFGDIIIVSPIGDWLSKCLLYCTCFFIRFHTCWGTPSTMDYRWLRLESWDFLGLWLKGVWLKQLIGTRSVMDYRKTDFGDLSFIDQGKWFWQTIVLYVIDIIKC